MMHAWILPLMLLAQQTPPPRPNVRTVTTPAKPVESPAPEKKPDGDGEKDPELTTDQLEARSLAGRALEAFQKPDYPKAAELAQAARQLDPRYALSVKILGWCAVTAGEDKKAADLLTDALNLDPADAELQYLLARTHVRIKEWGAAKDLLADLIKKHGPTPLWLTEVANACIGEEDWVGAETALLQAEKLDPSNREIANDLIDVYEQSDQPEKAIALLRGLIKEFQGEAPLRYREAHLLINQQKFEEGASVLEDAARVFPEESMSHEMLVQLYTGPMPDKDRREFHQNWLKEWKLRRR